MDLKAESTKHSEKIYRSPVPRRSVEPGSTVADNGVSVDGLQEATTRSNSAPKARVEAPNPAVL